MEQAVKILFIILLIIFPLGQIGRVELGGGVGLLFNDIAVFAVVTFWLVHKLLSRKPIEVPPLTVPIFLFVAAASLSLIVNLGKFSLTEIGIGSLYLLRWVLYGGLYFVVSDFSKGFKRKILYGLFAVGTITSLIGFIQYFFYPNLRNLYYVGWDEHLYRMFSTFLDPNFLGGILVLTFILAFSFSLDQKRHSGERSDSRISKGFWTSPATAGSRYWRGQNDKKKIFVIFTALVSFIGLLLTYSRGSFISFFVGTTLFLWFIGKKRLIILSFIGIAVGILLLPKNLQSEGVKLLRTASIDARLASLKQGMAIFQDNPILGVGFNTYRFAQEKYGFLKPTKAEYDRSAAGTDNSFLFVLATTGIVGFLAYANLWIRVVGAMRGNPLVLASLVAILVHALFVNSLFYPWIMEWLWILIGVSKAQKLP